MEKTTMEDYLKPTIDQFWETVPMVWNLIHSHLRLIAAEQFDISVEQYQVMRHIRKGLTSVKDIADARQISRPAVSQVVDLLVEKDLVTRREEAGDRRYVHLALTPLGEDLINEMYQQNRAWMMEKLASINAEDLNLITEGLALLKAAFEIPAEKIPANPSFS
jgi:DNA-binding MarR family transcriptional regulator